MRKGFSGILAALVFASVLFHSATLKKHAFDAVSQSRARALFIEKVYYDELSFKDAISSALARESGGGKVKGGDREEKATAAALALAGSEAKFKSFFENNGARAMLWWGFASESEIPEIRDKSLFYGVPLKCDCCWGFGETSSETPLLSGIIDFDAEKLEMKISKNRANFSMLPQCENGKSPGPGANAMIGATVVYAREETAAVFVAGEGFSAKIEGRLT